MKILVFGSLNIDRTYTVDHFVKPGETMSADKMELFCGGKGFNQAVALARAGESVYFAGAVGVDGDFLLDNLSSQGVNTEFVKRTAGQSGHAVIQVNKDGQNCIILASGANGEITESDVDGVLADFGEGDLIVLQNEISSLAYILHRAHEKGMTVALNPSPYNEKIDALDMNAVDYLFVNEVEGAGIGGKGSPAEILALLHGKYPAMNVVLTLGEAGSLFMDKCGNISSCGIFKTTVRDTTAAGDTFTGFFLSSLMHGENAPAALMRGAIASGISVSRVGAFPSIPSSDEVDAADKSLVGTFKG